MVKNADLLSLQLGHWTFVLGSAEETNVCVLTHWKQKESQKLKQEVLSVSLFTITHQSRNDGALRITHQSGTRQIQTKGANIILTNFLIMTLILIRTSDLKLIKVRAAMTGRTEAGGQTDQRS